ncbi:MAG TPA: sugar ABC transporter permease [Anaerolineales bacterium]|jgi:raffinose/stachyose/melibiose transport system permease protein|nr:sugar ABC transporter permease [Anaerolineales bacterium]HQX17649.1 sugar ABC transporter permease [Anaerolineales bacterium]
MTRAQEMFSVKNRQTITWILFLLPAVAMYLVFMAGPLFDSLRLSLYQGEGYNPTTFVGLQNYRDLFTNPLWREKFFNAFANTCIFFAIHMLVQNTLGLLFANLLSSEFRGRNFFRTVIFAPATLSVLVTGFLWTLILNPNWGAVNKTLIAMGLREFALPWLGRENLALPVISLTSVWQWVGMPTVMFLAGLMGISDELLEAARIDGASEWNIFWKIKFPLLKPVIGVVSILTFVDNFNAFDVIYAMAGAKGEPAYSTDLLATLFYRTGIAGEHPVGIPNMGMGAAIATMTFAILMTGVLFWLYISRKQATE